MHFYLIKHFLRISVEGIISLGPFRVSVLVHPAAPHTPSTTPHRSTLFPSSCVLRRKLHLSIAHFPESTSAFPLSQRMCFGICFRLETPDRWAMSMASNGISLQACRNDYGVSAKKQSSLLFTLDLDTPGLATTTPTWRWYSKLKSNYLLLWRVCLSWQPIKPISNKRSSHVQFSVFIQVFS